MSVTWIYTNSYDGTSDMLISCMSESEVFRFNLDLWAEYAIRIDADGFELRDPSGRTLRQQDVAKLYWRKPYTRGRIFPEEPRTREQSYLDGEMEAALQGIVQELWRNGKAVLTEPRADVRLSKLFQLQRARQWFQIPEWKFVCGGAEWLRPSGTSVVKSLTSQRIAEDSVLYTTRVEEAELDASDPWFVQDEVTASADVTVAWVRGECFAFELDRKRTASVDWRKAPLEERSTSWLPHPLPKELSSAIHSYMDDLELDYGRLDFLLAGPEREYHFLEVNPNGEWGWLDAHGEHGLRDRIVAEVSPSTPVHPIRPLLPGAK